MSEKTPEDFEGQNYTIYWSGDKNAECLVRIVSVSEIMPDYSEFENKGFNLSDLSFQTLKPGISGSTSKKLTVWGVIIESFSDGWSKFSVDGFPVDWCLTAVEMERDLSEFIEV